MRGTRYSRVRAEALEISRAVATATHVSPDRVGQPRALADDPVERVVEHQRPLHAAARDAVAVERRVDPDPRVGLVVGVVRQLPAEVAAARMRDDDVAPAGPRAQLCAALRVRKRVADSRGGGLSAPVVVPPW